MALKSVSINTKERFSIIEKIKKQYTKLATLKHPNPDFTKNLSKALYKKHIDILAEKVNLDVVPYIKYESVATFSDAIIALKLAKDISLKVLDTQMRFSTDLLTTTHSLTGFESSEIIIPAIFANKKKASPFPFTKWGQSKYNADRLTVDQDTMDSINEYNSQMDSVYSELSTQLDNLISAVEKCKSTKMFEDKLPNLVSLYPASVHKKINEKNDTTNTEITPEQQSLLDATASLAAAALLEDK